LKIKKFEEIPEKPKSSQKPKIQKEKKIHYLARASLKFSQRRRNSCFI
jgi:hypothetical protein